MSHVVPLTPAQLDAALAIVDLTDPARGPHAVQLLVDAVRERLAGAGPRLVALHRAHPVTAIEDNYDHLGYPADAPAREARYTRYVSATQLLRSHTSAMIPPLLRSVRRSGVQADQLWLCPGITYRRDVIDRLHTGEPHQLDVWRLSPAASGPLGEAELVAMIGQVVAACLPDAVWRTTPATHPYTTAGRQIDVRHGASWIEVGECGLAHPAVLAAAGLEASGWSGLAMGVGLDRLVMLRKGMDDIRLLRSRDARIAEQLRDLRPYRPVSRQPAIARDLSIAVAEDDDAELLGDRVRAALGPDAVAVESVSLAGETPYQDLPAAAVARLGLRHGQKNVLVRVVLRHLERTLTHQEANQLRDRIYAALHQGDRHQWAVTLGSGATT